MLTRRRAIYAKIEATQGVMEAITDADVVSIVPFDVKFTPDVKVNERNPILPTLSPVAPVVSTRSGKISFKTELKGPAATYAVAVKPAFSIFARACGLAEVVTTAPAGSETIVYTVASSNVPALTIWSNIDGECKKLYGARGTVKIEGKNGEPAYMMWEFTGVYSDVATLALPVVALEQSVPPVCMNAAFQLDGYDFKIEKFSIDLGIQVALIPDMNSVDGFAYAAITARKPTLSFDPEAVALATYDIHGKLKSGAQGALSIGPIGVQDYNRWLITAPKCTYTKADEGDRNGIYTYDVQVALSMDAGDDEFVLTFQK